MNEYFIVQTHIDDIRVGDVVMFNGGIHTVGANNINRGGFNGTALFGDTYNLGTKPVEKCLMHLREVLAHFGYTAEPSKFPGKKRIFRRGVMIGDFTAHETWEYINKTHKK